jgi:D-lactate dehydrogenase
MYDVVFYEVFKEEKIAIQKYLSKKLSVQFLEAALSEKDQKKPLAKILSIRTHSRVPINWSHQIQGILSRSQGFDHLKEYCYRTGFPAKQCGYLPHYCDRAVAEHAVLMMMSLLRKLKKQLRHFESFNRNDLSGHECYHKNALIVGVGHIGKDIALLCRGLGMYVRGVDLLHRERTIQYVSLKDGIPWADVIFCALPLTEKTRGALGYALLKNVRPGTLLVNVSRGEVTPSQDLQRLLKERILGGLGLDVYSCEDELGRLLRLGRGDKISPDTKAIADLRNEENVIFTPHNAFNTTEALERKAVYSVEAIKAFFKEKQFPCHVK